MRRRERSGRWRIGVQPDTATARPTLAFLDDLPAPLRHRRGAGNGAESSPRRGGGPRLPFAGPLLAGGVGTAAVRLRGRGLRPAPPAVPLAARGEAFLPTGIPLARRLRCGLCR